MRDWIKITEIYFNRNFNFVVFVIEKLRRNSNAIGIVNVKISSCWPSIFPSLHSQWSDWDFSPTKLREGKAFTGICHSVRGVWWRRDVVKGGGVWIGRGEEELASWKRPSVMAFWCGLLIKSDLLLWLFGWKWPSVIVFLSRSTQHLLD